MFANRYGQFDASGRVFTLSDPNPPMPWVNVISNGRYGVVVSHNGGGFSFYDDAQHCVITRWEMDLARDSSGKFLYLTDLASGDTWSAAPSPCRPEYSSYSCAHTQGSTTITTERGGIRCEWTIGVAPSDAVELWMVRLTNTGGATRRLRIASYLEWCCGVAPDAKREFHRLFITTRHDATRRAITATKSMWDIPPGQERDHWNQPWPYAAAHAVSGAAFEHDIAIGDKRLFLGRYGSPERPAAMRADHPHLEDSAPPPEARRGSIGGFGRFGDGVASLGGDLTLAPGASASLHYILGIGASEHEALALVDRYRDGAAARHAIDSAAMAWRERLGATSVRTQRRDFDLLNNHWLPYQAISGRLWGRTGLYQQSGAFGFRDQLQDSQVWLPIEPARCLDQLLLHATRQFVDGSVNHWWHALADFGNHTACSDDYLWLPFVTASYLKETGDFAALGRTAPWRDSTTPATLLEHCTRSFTRAVHRMSPRGLPLIGSCDWNDGLSAMGVEEKGESVWLGMWLCGLLDDWATILDAVGDDASAGDFRARRQKLIEAINAHAWDGAWYRYGTKDSGEWVGSSACDSGQIHLNAQTWAILNDIGPRERADRAWASVQERLLSDFGPLLLHPAYSVPDASIGYITRYSPGGRENGGVYMHAATWALAAACKRRDTESVGRIWRSISPPVRGENAEAYWAEPYVTPGNVDGPASDLPGRAGWTWYTGSAAWLNKVSLEWVLGVRPTWRGLLVDPVPPGELGVVRAERRWRGVKLVIGFDSAAYRAEERARIVVNGRELRENVIDPSLALAAAAGDGVLNVEVSWAPRTCGAGVSDPNVQTGRPASEMRGTQEAKAEKVAT